MIDEVVLDGAITSVTEFWLPLGGWGAAAAVVWLIFDAYRSK